MYKQFKILNTRFNLTFVVLGRQRRVPVWSYCSNGVSVAVSNSNSHTLYRPARASSSLAYTIFFHQVMYVHYHGICTVKIVHFNHTCVHNYHSIMYNIVQPSKTLKIHFQFTDVSVSLQLIPAPDPLLLTYFNCAVLINNYDVVYLILCNHPKRSKF